TYSISVPFTLDPNVVIIISVIGGIAVASLVTFQQLRKRAKVYREFRENSVMNKCNDLLNLNYIMVIDKKTGINVFEQYFSGKTFEPTLISGFFEAIRQFGIELASSYEQSQTIKLEYQDSKIIMSEFKEFRLLLIMKDNPSKDLLEAIKQLSYEIEENFGEKFKKFVGEVAQFQGIKDLIEKHLLISFISPLTVKMREDVKLPPSERHLVKIAQEFMKENSMDYFFTTFLIPGESCDYKTVDSIFNLINKDIFQQVSLEENES
ncbi:MAG: hypothetical protein ACFFCS_19775, partial [Candidatus Hodarchaeota archaeon]